MLKIKLFYFVFSTQIVFSRIIPVDHKSKRILNQTEYDEEFTLTNWWDEMKSNFDWRSKDYQEIIFKVKTEAPNSILALSMDKFIEIYTKDSENRCILAISSFVDEYNQQNLKETFIEKCQDLGKFIKDHWFMNIGMLTVDKVIYFYEVFSIKTLESDLQYTPNEYDILESQNKTFLTVLKKQVRTDLDGVQPEY